MSNEQQPSGSQDEAAKLWTFCNKALQGICENYASNNDLESINGLVEALSFIV
jgi:hypothetical protein